MNTNEVARQLQQFATAIGHNRTPAPSVTLYPVQRKAAENVALALSVASLTEIEALPDSRLISLIHIAKKSPEAAARKLAEFTAHFHPIPEALAVSTPAPSNLPYELLDRVETIENKQTALFHDTGHLRTSAERLGRAIEAANERINALETSAPTALQITLPDAPTMIINGAHPEFSRVLRKLARGVNVWLCGPRGSGKSYAAEQFAEALGVPCHIMTGADDQFALIGYFQPHDGSLVRTPFREAWEHGGVICLDELDTYNPQAIIVMNDALANGKCTFPDGPVKRHPKCYVMAGTNTDGRGADNLYSARSVLCGSTRDRLEFIRWEYCKAVEDSMGAICPAWVKYVQAVRQYMNDNAIDEAPSPRTSKMGAEAIMLDGDTWEQAAAATMWKGLSPDIVARINRAVPMSQFKDN